MLNFIKNILITVNVKYFLNIIFQLVLLNASILNITLNDILKNIKI